MKKTKKRNYAANDATLINIRALKKNVSEMEDSLDVLVGWIYGPLGLLDRIQQLELASRSKKTKGNKK